jgi:selenide,water dikinase
LFLSEDHPDLLVGLGVPDDAAVWKINDDLAMVVTTDFFTPVVDDPYDYGSIAAANALSDLYAMGAWPVMALNIAAFPPQLPSEVIEQIILGGAEKVKEAGAALAGGHTIQDNEPKYGLVAVGLVEPGALLTKSGVRPGDALVLTKPLGMGVTTTALKRGQADSFDVAQAVRWMKLLNAAAAEAAHDLEVDAATDVTGFSLLGHASEMMLASQVGIEFFLPSIPFISGARKYAEAGNFPGGTADNKMHFETFVNFDDSIDDYTRMLLFDAQTSGGLLCAMPPSKAQAFQRRMKEAGQAAWIIGRAFQGEGVMVRSQPTPEADKPVIGDEPIWYAD